MAVNPSVIHDHGVECQRLTIDLDAIRNFYLDLMAPMQSCSGQRKAFLVTTMFGGYETYQVAKTFWGQVSHYSYALWPSSWP